MYYKNQKIKNNNKKNQKSKRIIEKEFIKKSYRKIFFVSFIDLYVCAEKQVGTHFDSDKPLSFINMFFPW